MGLGLRKFRRRTEDDKKSKIFKFFKQQQQYLGIQSVDKEMNMNLEQRRREVRKIRRIYNMDQVEMLHFNTISFDDQ